MLASPSVIRTALAHRRVLWSTVLFELSKKYAGSALGWLWIGLHPVLFLSAYVIVFMVIFKVTLPGMTPLGYVAFVFSGLIPFLSLMEVTTTAVVTIRQNIHLIKNVILPIDIVPIRIVLAALLVQGAGLSLLLVILALDGGLSTKLLLLPVVMVFTALFLAGLAMILAPLGLILPDLAHGIGILMNLLMFVSPIAFKRDQVPDLVKFLVDFNPAAYLIEAYRSVLVAGYQPDLHKLVLFVILSLVLFELGAQLLNRFKTSIVDYE